MDLTPLDIIGLTLGVIALACLCLPCRYDPAIILCERLREHAKRKKEHLDGWPKRNPPKGP
jgi:hypothetical protein